MPLGIRIESGAVATFIDEAIASTARWAREPFGEKVQAVS
jgi:hypothetical protein